MTTDTANPGDLVALIEEMRSELRALVGRVAELEQRLTPSVAAVPDAPPAAAAAPPARATEEDLLVIAAAVAAFLGVRAQIRQVRLVQSATWAQVGRATVHASHRVH